MNQLIAVVWPLGEYPQRDVLELPLGEWPMAAAPAVSFSLVSSVQDFLQVCQRPFNVSGIEEALSSRVF